ncbi:uncharacterized protein LOC142775869 isoform X1 [Rhipicephalus microplus]|uniref:uncharacterized protein LOC142775869 isoform X1 n=1 Tax=Rhipicephalus microplus TaxID=6941 RepID=UPI003F6D5A6D
MAPKKMRPFCFLLRELQNERRERNFAGTLEAVRAEAGEMWKSLTEEEKAHDEFVANRYKEKQVGSLENSFTPDGRSIAHAYQLPSPEAPTLVGPTRWQRRSRQVPGCLSDILQRADSACGCRCDIFLQ